MRTLIMDDYEKGGFGTIDIGFGERPAILAVDFQNAHLDPAFPFGGKPLALRAFENTKKLLSVARAKKIPVAVCYTAHQRRDDMPHTRIKTVRDQYFEGNPIIALDESIVDRDYDYVTRKTGPSMFYETRLEPFLTKKSVDTLIITGVNTSGCIRATVIDSYQRLYRTIVPEDCVGDVAEEPHRYNLLDIGRRYADIVDLKRVLAYLDRL
jgi:maleamate amidohydrolase